VSSEWPRLFPTSQALVRSKVVAKRSSLLITKAPYVQIVNSSESCCREEAVVRSSRSGREHEARNRVLRHRRADTAFSLAELPRR